LAQKQADCSRKCRCRTHHPYTRFFAALRALSYV
jgi:hypothetical protein